MTPQSATGGQATMWAGGELSIYNPDWGCQSNLPFNCPVLMIGPTAYFDFNWNKRIGAEGDAHWLLWHGPQGEKESSYLLGPRYRLWRGDRFSFSGRLGLGGEWLQTAGYPQAGSLKGSFFAIAPGADLDYNVSERMLVRADYEYQFLPSFSGGPGHNNGLTPNGFSFGVAWRILGR
ncbi:MAG TPA: outer membrane beta-barrel protein [Acidobacteriaceae bacterium]|nr:outer membrane beta-barrel protein [Acidobacteriaceae bacterium]